MLLDLGTKEGWGVSVTPRPLYPRERPGIYCTGGWVGPKADLDRCGKSRPHRDFFNYFFLYHSWPFLTVFYLFGRFLPFRLSFLVVRVTNMGQIILLPLPKKGMLWIFPAGKIRGLRSGANPRSWVPEASVLTPRPPKPLGFDPRTVQLVVSRYTDWATRPTVW
jgi:hypothetical protein